MKISDPGKPPQMCTIEQHTQVHITQSSISGVFAQRTVNIVEQRSSQYLLLGAPASNPEPSLLVRLKESGGIQQVVCLPELNLSNEPRIVILQVVPHGAAELVGDLICQLIKLGMTAAPDQPHSTQNPPTAAEDGELSAKEAQLPRRALLAEKSVPGCPLLQPVDERSNKVLIKLQLIDAPIAAQPSQQNQEQHSGNQAFGGNQDSGGNFLQGEDESAPQQQGLVTKGKSDAKLATTPLPQTVRPSKPSDASINTESGDVSRSERQALPADSKSTSHANSAEDSAFAVSQSQKPSAAVSELLASVKPMESIETPINTSSQPSQRPEAPAEGRARNDNAAAVAAQNNNSAAKGAAPLAAAISQQAPAAAPASAPPPLNDSGPKQMPPIIVPVAPPPDGGNRSAGEKKKERKWFEEKRDQEDDDDDGESNEEWFEDEEDDEDEEE